MSMSIVWTQVYPPAAMLAQLPCWAHIKPDLMATRPLFLLFLTLILLCPAGLVLLWPASGVQNLRLPPLPLRRGLLLLLHTSCRVGLLPLRWVVLRAQPRPLRLALRPSPAWLPTLIFWILFRIPLLFPG